MVSGLTVMVFRLIAVRKKDLPIHAAARMSSFFLFFGHDLLLMTSGATGGFAFLAAAEDGLPATQLPSGLTFRSGRVATGFTVPTGGLAFDDASFRSNPAPQGGDPVTTVPERSGWKLAVTARQPFA